MVITETANNLNTATFEHTDERYVSNETASISEASDSSTSSQEIETSEEVQNESTDTANQTSSEGNTPKAQGSEFIPSSTKITAIESISISTATDLQHMNKNLFNI